MDLDAVSFSFDIGTNSIGWSILALDECGRPGAILAAGVRIFSSGMKGRALCDRAEERRKARAARRRRDRYLRRRGAFLRELVAMGLLPAGKDGYAKLIRAGCDRRMREPLSIEDPHILRARALHETLAPHQLGRALFHLSKTRGRPARRVLRLVTAGKTRGEILALRRVSHLPVRRRPSIGDRTGMPFPEDFDSREAVEDEFLRIWASQSGRSGSTLTDEGRERLRKILFGEPSQPQSGPGCCRLVRGDERVPKAHRLFQRFRILKELNELYFCDKEGDWRAPTIAERNRLASLLTTQEFASWEELRAGLGLGSQIHFNKETPGRGGLIGNEARAGKDPRFLPSGNCRYGARALGMLNARMEEEVISETEAIRRCRSALEMGRSRKSAVRERLPPYGEILLDCHRGAFAGTERIANNVIHVALNQLRRVCNALITRFGKPAFIAVESMHNRAPKGEARERWDTERLRRLQANADLKSQFTALREIHSHVADTRRNRLKFRLWHELDPQRPDSRKCIYTGNVIEASQLFTPAVEIDHVLPRSHVRNNRRENLTICLSAANRLKGARRPGACSEWADEFPAIGKRAAILPADKARLFDLENPALEETGPAFPPRQLSDTRRLAKYARAYLRCLYGDEPDAFRAAGGQRVICVTGRVTANLRSAWRLDNLFEGGTEANSGQGKNRNDYRQHAVDAMIIGAAAGFLAEDARFRDNAAACRPPLPWAGFREDVKRCACGIVVSHKPDHGKARGANAPGDGKSFGRLHNDSAYGLTREGAPNGKPVIVRRRPFNALRPTDLGRIRDEHLRDRLTDFMQGASGREFSVRLIAFSREDPIYRGIRRARLMEAADVIVVKDKTGRAYKAYKGNSNFRFDIWQLQNGKWVSEVVTMFDAHQAQWQSPVRATHHNPKKVLSLKQQDMIAIDGAEGETRILRVVKFSRDGRICFAPHNEAGDLKRRDASPSDPFRYITMAASSLKKKGARQIRVDELGIVSDPGSVSSR